MPVSSATVSVNSLFTASVQAVVPCTRYCVLATPETVSVAVSATVTSLLYQPEAREGVDSAVTLGSVSSMLTQAVCVASTLPARSNER